jgi:three-Cys-motif partner protein
VADTKKVDLWLLVPLGQAVARMLPVGQPPPEAWQHKLTSFLGTDAWLEKLYRQKVTPGLFGTEMVVERERGHATIVGFIQERLRSAFAHVMSEPLMLLNGRGTPLYMLCFGAGNLRGGKNAVKIAQDIARKRTRG